MRIRITSSTSEQAALLLRTFTVWLEDVLFDAFKISDFGVDVDQFVAVFVAVSEDETENERFAVKHDQSGKYKDVRTGIPVKFIGVAVRLNPEYIAKLNTDQIKFSLIQALITRLNQPIKRVPKGFQLALFLHKINSVLQTLETLPQTK